MFFKYIFITISIGIAIYDPHKDHELDTNLVLKKYFTLCDQAMYRAKQAGRNQVSI
ncbi:diguanylate cyclase domain-containing protein [Polynucleobacter sp. UB-Piko-W3]|uniref:diguanylate cyclase domain-containing protein n=1 Tax=Polynucleobacter sp. UB-Piko-W3 TaxID=1819735 RepID=UPI001C0B4BF5|nr:diguanylate cyclase [Polynucleobacter sp. UB-Piko-W3]